MFMAQSTGLMRFATSPGLQRTNIAFSTATISSCGCGLSAYRAPTAASAADGQLNAMLAGGAATSRRTKSASTSCSMSAGSWSLLVPVLLLLVPTAAVAAAEGPEVAEPTAACMRLDGVRCAAAERKVRQVWRASQASCNNQQCSISSHSRITMASYKVVERGSSYCITGP